MPVVARNVDDRRDGNEWKFVTRSHGSFRSGVVGNGTYIYCSIATTSASFCVVVEFILGDRDTPSNFHFGGMELGTKVDRLIHRKRKIGRIKGLVMNFRSVNRENLWDRYVCVCVCVCTTPLFSLSLFFFSFLTNDGR